MRVGGKGIKGAALRVLVLQSVYHNCVLLSFRLPSVSVSRHILKPQNKRVKGKGIRSQ